MRHLKGGVGLAPPRRGHHQRAAKTPNLRDEALGIGVGVEVAFVELLAHARLNPTNKMTTE